MAAQVFYRRGKVAEARAAVSGLEPLQRGFMLLEMRLDGIDIPDGSLAIRLGDAPTDLTLGALLAAERGEWDDRAEGVGASGGDRGRRHAR